MKHYCAIHNHTYEQPGGCFECNLAADPCSINLADFDTIWTQTELSFIRIQPNIDGEEPVVDIFWNFDTEEIDAKFEGSVSEAAQQLVRVFAEDLWKYFQQQIGVAGRDPRPGDPEGAE